MSNARIRRARQQPKAAPKPTRSGRGVSSRRWPVTRPQDQWEDFVRSIPQPIEPGMRRAKALRRQLRQLSRAWFRGDLEGHFSDSVALIILPQFFGVSAVLKEQVRRNAARERLRQSIWLFMKQREMEDRLETLGLPRDAWRQGFDHSIWTEEPNPTDQLNYVINANEHARPATLWRWLQAAEPPRQWAGYCTAYAAWLAYFARLRRSPDLRFRFGRLLEACEGNLLFPERMRSAHAAAGELAASRYLKAAQPLHDKLREEARRLLAAGRSIRSAAEILAARQDLARYAEGLQTKMLTASGIRALLSSRRKRLVSR